MNRRTLKNDVLVIAAIAAVAAVRWCVVKLSSKTGEFAVVELNGVETARYSLNEDIRVDIACGDDCVNTLVIRNGEAYIESANCPDKLCVKQHGIRMTGETIICLPHRLIVRIIGEYGVDATA